MENIRTKKISAASIFQDYGAMIAFLMLFIVNAAITSNFLEMRTIWNILTQSSTTVLLALGMTLVIATGGINISVGSVMALSAMIAAKFIAEGQTALGLVLGMACAVFFGWLTGYAVIKFKIQSMIVSLSMMFVLRGIAKLLNDGRIMSYKNKAFTNFFYGEVFGFLPVRTFIWLALAVLLWIFITKTKYGVYVEAYGDNPEATRISGINVVAIISFIYILCNAFACAAGFIEAGYSTTVDPANMGLTKEMDAIAATVVGGTSISGGKPHIWGTVFGALVLQLITIMVNMNNIPVSYARILKAAIIIFAIYAQQASGRKK